MEDQQENKKRKKKMFIALVSLCSVLALTIVAMGIVWAATSQTISSNVKVIYTATDVSGSIAANVYFNSDTGVAMTTDGTSSGATTVTFNGETQTSTGSLSPQGTTTLANADGQRFVIYEYTITNTSTNQMSAALSYTDDTTSPNTADTNIKAYFYATTTQVSTPKTSVATLYGAEEANKLASATGSFGTTTIAANGTSYCYVVIAIDNVANDAEFSGTFSWLLTKATA